MRKLLFVCLAASTLALAAPAHADPNCHDVALGAGVGTGIGTGIAFGGLIGAASGFGVNQLFEAGCRHQEAHRPVAYKPQKGPWRNPDLAHKRKVKH